MYPQYHPQKYYKAAWRIGIKKQIGSRKTGCKAGGVKPNQVFLTEAKLT